MRKKTVTINIGNNFSIAELPDSRSIGIVKKLCSFEERSKPKDSNKWIFKGDKTSKLFEVASSNSISFYSGWAGTISKYLSKAGYLIEINDNRTKPTNIISSIKNSNIPENIIPRPYQEDAAKSLIDSTRGIISLGTAGGKTVIAAMIIRELGLNTVFMVPNENLVTQSYNTFCSWFTKKNVGIVGIGKMETDKPIIVATAQTLWSRIKSQDEQVLSVIAKTDLLMIDECHHVNANVDETNTWFQTSLQFDSYYRIGMTATPGRDGTLSRRILEAATGRIVVDIPISYLTEHNYITPVNVFMIPVDCKMSFSGLWNKNYTTNVVNNEIRNRLICELAVELTNSGKKVLIVLNRVEKHGEKLYKELRKYLEHRVDYMFGTTSTDDRKTKLDKFHMGKIMCMIGTVFNEGVDIPSIDVVINAGAGKSETLLTQRIGRGLRLSPSKKFATMIDFVDNDKKAYLPDRGSVIQKVKITNEPGMMLAHSMSRADTYIGEGHTLYFTTLPELIDNIDNPNLTPITEVPKIGWETVHLCSYKG
jgi:superfamily II DNA or RNA helicase